MLSAATLTEDAHKAAEIGNLSAAASALQSAANIIDAVATDAESLPDTSGELRAAASRFRSAANQAIQQGGLSGGVADLISSIEHMKNAEVSAQREGAGRICQQSSSGSGASQQANNSTGGGSGPVASHTGPVVEQLIGSPDNLQGVRFFEKNEPCPNEFWAILGLQAPGVDEFERLANENRRTDVARSTERDTFITAFHSRSSFVMNNSVQLSEYDFVRQRFVVSFPAATECTAFSSGAEDVTVRMAPSFRRFFELKIPLNIARDFRASWDRNPAIVEVAFRFLPTKATGKPAIQILSVRLRVGPVPLREPAIPLTKELSR